MGHGSWIRDMGSWVCAPIVIWVFVGCAAMGFCWLWWSNLWVWLWVMGVIVGLALGRGSWLWCWVIFLLGLPGSNGGLVSGYNDGWLCLCCGFSSDLWCWVGCAMSCGLIYGFSG